MPKPHASRIEALAIAVATGTTVRAWSKANGVPLRTCYDWSRKPEFEKRVRQIHGEMIARLLGQLTQLSGAAVKALKATVDVTDKTVPAGARVTAALGVVDRLLSVRTHAQLEERLAQLEERLAEMTPPKGDP